MKITRNDTFLWAFKYNLIKLIESSLIMLSGLAEGVPVSQSVSGCVLTSRVSAPPTMLRPSPVRPLEISIVVSQPGMMGQVAGSEAKIAGVDDLLVPKHEMKYRLIRRHMQYTHCTSCLWENEQKNGPKTGDKEDFKFTPIFHIPLEPTNFLWNHGWESSELRCMAGPKTQSGKATEHKKREQFWSCNLYFRASLSLFLFLLIPESLFCNQSEHYTAELNTWVYKMSSETHSQYLSCITLDVL